MHARAREEYGKKIPRGKKNKAGIRRYVSSRIIRYE